MYYTSPGGEPHDVRGYVEFVYLATYVRLAKGVVSDDIERAFEAEILANPAVGDVIAGTGGVRKVRIALPGRGKRGGARFLYHYWHARGRVYVIAIYAKNVRPSITMADKRELRRLVAQLEKGK